MTILYDCSPPVRDVTFGRASLLTNPASHALLSTRSPLDRMMVTWRGPSLSVVTVFESSPCLSKSEGNPFASLQARGRTYRQYTLYEDVMNSNIDNPGWCFPKIETLRALRLCVMLMSFGMRREHERRFADMLSYMDSSLAYNGVLRLYSPLPPPALRMTASKREYPNRPYL